MAIATDTKLEVRQQLALKIRRWILQCTTEADSGHPTSSLSATELMTQRFFGGHYRYDVEHPARPDNDRLIFSEGHASPLFYALWAAAGQVDEERLGQRGKTMYGHDLSEYQKRIEAFGWNTVMVSDGHDFAQLAEAYHQATASQDQPTMVIAWTVKGKGVSFLENEPGWHGKSLDNDQLLCIKSRPSVTYAQSPGV